MALAAIGYAKTKLRRQIMIATTLVGPGATNIVTAAGVADSNRLPVLLLSVDTYNNGLPNPVLQQAEHFGEPSTTVNDSFRAEPLYCNRIIHPAQILSSLPQAVATMADRADCGHAFIYLPQDVEEIAYDYPVEFFSETTWRIPRVSPDVQQVDEVVKILKRAKKPLIISGGADWYVGVPK